MQLHFTTVEGLKVGRAERVEKVRKVIDRRKQARAELLKRSEELKAKAENLRRSDPAQARRLEQRAIHLANEEYRMRQENQRAMKYDQLRRSTLLAEIALLVDGAKK